jgi:hypothetical protein
LRSIAENAGLGSNADILIITTNQFRDKIEGQIGNICQLKYHIIYVEDTLMEASCAKTRIFSYEFIDNYDKILYLDTDVLITRELNTLLGTDISDNKIYGLEEGFIGHAYWGGDFFDFSKFDKNMPAFSAGVLYFKNSPSMKDLFIRIRTHIVQSGTVPVCLDQPFVVFNAVYTDRYDNKLLKNYIEDNPKFMGKASICHFSGGPGQFSSKYEKMCNFYLNIRSERSL